MMELVPNIVDSLAKLKPEALYAEYPVSTLSYEEGYRRITYGNLANAINGLAWYLHDELGPGENFEVLTFIGPNDLRYPALILGAVKAGYTIFLTSPRNSVAAQIHLLDRLKCRTILSASPRSPAITAILASQDLRVLEIPSVGDLLKKDHVRFPYEKNFSDALSEPLFVVHTSGSTGPPKPIYFTHDSAARNMALLSLDPPVGFVSQNKMYMGKRIFSTFPPFHAAFLALQLFSTTIHCQTVIIAPISGIIPSAKGLVEGLKRTPADIAFLVPSIVKELSESPDLLDYCIKHLEMIFFCGGDLPASIGDVVSSKMSLVNQFGATEIGLIAQIQPQGLRDPKDWKYTQFHPETGAELRHDTDAAHELYIVRDPRLEKHQPTFTFFPDLQEYSSRDLFVRHSSKDKADLWKWHARADDIIVFLNGEKTNPIQMEQLIVSSNPEVTGALVAGAQRFQAALLIERVVNDDVDGKEPSPSERAAFIEKIWATVEKANEICPAHARITKSQILFTKPEKPMMRAGKGTIQRAATLQLYAQELDALYADADTFSVELDGETSIGLGILEDASATSHFIRETVSSITNWLEFDDADNFFTLGMDSLQALRVLRNLKQGLSLPTIALSTIYTNPSISALSSATIRLSTQDQERQSSENEALFQERSLLFREYQDLIDRIPIESNFAKEAQDHDTVILTGSTGSLGSYLLQTLVSNPAVAHVYCLNRAPQGSLRIQRTKARGLPNEVSSPRVTFLTADLPQTYLGLQPEVYKKLIETVTLVIHNAWPVNFNLPLLSFRPQLSGLVNLIELTALARTAPHLFFISSISSVLSYQSPSLITPEQVLPLDSALSPSGYAASKFLSEHLLDYAARRLDINTSFARIGQIAGAAYSPGLWNKTEWFPSLVISSLYVGTLPDSLGRRFSKIDWIPIDLLADILVELALAENPQQRRFIDIGDDVPTRGAQVLHIINPNSTTWETLRPIVAEALSAFSPQTEKAALDIVSPSMWLEKIRKAMESTSGGKTNHGDLEAALELNPAAKLLAFYQDVLLSSTNKAEGISPPEKNKLETRETVGKSIRLGALEAIKTEWLQKWIREWFNRS